MKTAVLLVAASALLAASAFAQSPPAQTAVPPPPGINDPGVHAVAPASSTAAAAPSSSHSLDLKPLALPAMKSGDSTLGRGGPVPDVSVRQEGDNNIQEYRRNGRVYMVVVTPKNGIAQTYMVDPEGRLVDEHGQKPARPVMYKVLEWGKSKPAAADSNEATPAGDGH